MGVVSYENYKNKKEEIKKLKNEINEKNNQINKKNNQINENDKNKKEEIIKLQNQIIEKNNQIKENYIDFQRLDTENSQLKKEKQNLKYEKEELLNIYEKKQNELIEELNKYKEENKNLRNKINNNDFNEIYSSFENQMNTRIDNFLNNNCENIQEIIEEKFKNYFKNVKFELQNEIINILNKENSNNFFENKIEELSSIIIKDYVQKTKHLNIYLVGKSGIGKSTLINKIIGKKEAKTGVGRPVTQITKSYESNNIRLWDTKGIEMSEYNLKKVINETKTLIKKNEEKNNPDEYIHCIWYCINGSKFEEVEEKAVKELANVYDDSSLPIVIVNTHTLSKNLFENMKKYIKSNEKLKDIDILPVLAEDDIAADERPIKSFGIKELLQLTISKLKNATSHISFTIVKKKIKEKINESISQIKNCFYDIEQKLKLLNNFNETKEYLKNNINKFYIKIIGKEINDSNIKNYIDKLSSYSKYEVESYFYYLLIYMKDKIKQFYLNEFKIYKINYKKNIKFENEKLEDNNKEILFFEKILNKVENYVNEQINNFIKNIHIYITQVYYEIINENISNIINKTTEKYKTKIIKKMQIEIENNQSFKELFRNFY